MQHNIFTTTTFSQRVTTFFTTYCIVFVLQWITILSQVKIFKFHSIFYNGSQYFHESEFFTTGHQQVTIF